MGSPLMMAGVGEGRDGMSWQVVALAEEVAQAPMAVRTPLHEVALFRDKAGACRAVLDRCAHRRAPLSIGRVTDEGLIECPYHGWRYDGKTGACRAIPNLSAQEEVPKAYGVPAFAVAETGGFILIGSSEGDNHSAPAIPALSEHAIARRTRVAFPAGLYIDALLDCPSALIGIGDLGIVDDRRFGNPEVASDGVVVSFAVAPLSALKSGKVVADFPFVLTVRAPLDGGSAELVLADIAGEDHARMQLFASARDHRVTDILTRAEGPRAQAMTVHRTLDGDRLGRSGGYVSGLRAQARDGRPSLSIAS